MEESSRGGNFDRGASGAPIANPDLYSLVSEFGGPQLRDFRLPANSAPCGASRERSGCSFAHALFSAVDKNQAVADGERVACPRNLRQVSRASPKILIIAQDLDAAARSLYVPRELATLRGT